MKKSKIIVLCFFGIALFYWFFYIRASSSEFCIQVVTDAKNPLTGKVKSFATPCDVPLGWSRNEPVIIK